EADGANTKATVNLLFEEPHDSQDIAKALGERLPGVQVVQDARANGFVASATLPGSVTRDRIHTDVTEALGEAGTTLGIAFNVAQSIPSLSTVGPQVVGELRDKAFLALVFSLFVTVIYIRVRFAEYSYGIAAVAALIHDVLTTLAAITVGNLLGIVN